MSNICHKLCHSSIKYSLHIAEALLCYCLIPYFMEKITLYKNRSTAISSLNRKAINLQLILAVKFITNYISSPMHTENESTSY